MVNSLGGPFSWMGGISRDLQGGANSVSQVDVVQIWHHMLVLWLFWGKVQKRDNGLCPPFYVGEIFSPGPTLV